MFTTREISKVLEDLLDKDTISAFEKLSEIKADGHISNFEIYDKAGQLQKIVVFTDGCKIIFERND